MLRYCLARPAGIPCRAGDMPAGVASVAKRPKAPVCGTGDHGFESRRSPQALFFRGFSPFAPVAQWIEHWASDPGVAGSSPARRAIERFPFSDYLLSGPPTVSGMLAVAAREAGRLVSCFPAGFPVVVFYYVTWRPVDAGLGRPEGAHGAESYSDRDSYLEQEGYLAAGPQAEYAGQAG